MSSETLEAAADFVPHTSAVGLDSQPSEHLTPIDFYLREQQSLSAVERFSQHHEFATVPAQSRHYKSLLPVTTPQDGEQYAFEVDLDRCSGCKACVTACHSMNGLDADEAWRDVGLLHGGTDEDAVIQHVTTACHHCLDPACLNVCPVDAYEKDPVTGIVHHLDDQCFGCQYCTLACPYNVPKYNKQLGIVRKCDMCSQRLAVGEAPACVQACPHEAIAIKVVNQQQVIEDCETNLFLPGAPEPNQTLPTTTFKTERVLPRNLLPADYYSVHREHAHWPLVIMLVLTQLSVGAFLVEHVMDWLVGPKVLVAVRPAHAVTALVFGLLALVSSTFHLGRPRYAYRAMIGLRHSWLSREIVAFGLFAGLAVFYAAARWLLPESLEADVIRPAGIAVVAAGMIGVCCSILIYQQTGRVFWSGVNTSIKFLSTTVILGLSVALLTVTVLAVAAGSEAARELLVTYGASLCQLLAAVSGGKLLFEASIFRHLWSRQTTPIKRSAMLMSGELASPTMARFAAGFLGGVWLPLFVVMGGSLSGSGDVFLVVVLMGSSTACVVGEMLERYLYFAAVVAPRMPGGLSA